MYLNSNDQIRAISFCSTGDWTLGAFCHWALSPALYNFNIEIGTKLQGWPQTCHAPDTASWVAGITGVCLHPLSISLNCGKEVRIIQIWGKINTVTIFSGFYGSEVTLLVLYIKMFIMFALCKLKQDLQNKVLVVSAENNYL